MIVQCYMDKLCNWYFSFYTAVTSLYLKLMVFVVFLRWKQNPAGYVATLQLWFGLWYKGYMVCFVFYVIF